MLPRLDTGTGISVPRRPQNVFHFLQGLIVRFSFDGNADLAPDPGIGDQYSRHHNKRLFKPCIQDQAVALKHTRTAAEFNFFGSERQPAAILQFRIYIDIVVHAFFERVGVEVEEDAIYLRPGGAGKEEEDGYETVT